MRGIHREVPTGALTVAEDPYRGGLGLTVAMVTCGVRYQPICGGLGVQCRRGTLGDLLLDDTEPSHDPLYVVGQWDLFEVGKYRADIGQLAS